MFSNTFPDRAVISETVAKMLLEINAVHFRADQPYTFTSGLASPVYIDCRKLISYPRIRSALMDFGASVIFRNVGFEQFDAVAGGETAGIPFAAWLADKTRNDLAIPARSLAPVLSQVQSALSATPGCLLARMSGSGGTHFGLYATEASSKVAGSMLRLEYPGWWVESGVILG